MSLERKLKALELNSLARMLNPKSIAVFGGAWASAVIRQTKLMGFTGEIWPLHPDKETVEGLQAYRSVADLPGSPDASFIGVNRHLTIELVRELAAINAGGVICFASGFSESGDDHLQAKLIAAAGDMPVLGPNCYGLLNYCDGVALWPDQHGGMRLAEGSRGAAIITQSSNIALNMTMQKRGLPLAFVMTAGNQAQTGLSKMAHGLIEDTRVSVLGLHIEGFDSVAGFEHLAARARELGKPIIALKVGASEQARLATISHTASLAGNDAASNAFLKRLGIGRVTSIPAFIETLKLLHVTGPISGTNISSMSCSGGEASVMADAVLGTPLTYPGLTEAHARRVKDTLGPLVAIANPLDYHTFIWNDLPAMTATFSAFVSGDYDLNFLVLDFPRDDRCSDKYWQNTVEAFDVALKASNAKGAVLASLPENLSEIWAADLIARNIAPMQGITEAMEAAEIAAFIGAAWASAPVKPLAAAKPQSGSLTTIDEARAKARLRGFGLRVPDGIMCNTPNEAAALAKSFGFPVALKALGVAHKTEANAVRLNLKSTIEVHQAAKELAGIGTGLYLERMVENPIAELIIGITRDPLFGPVLTIGTGGILVELLADTQTLLLPTNATEIEAALRMLRLFPLLDGYRGRPKADLAAAIKAITGIAAFALHHNETLVEMDINPLMVCDSGAWIADALIVETEPLLALQ
jgi:acetate---CoA ligase (ADP-forming)